MTNTSQIGSGCSRNASVFFFASFAGVGPRNTRFPLFKNLPLALFAAAFSVALLFLSACGDDSASKPAEQAAAKPPEPAVPEDMQLAAQSFLGKETKVLLFGDLAKTGRQQFLAANVIPKTPKNENLSGTIVTRAVIAEDQDSKWTELFRCDEHLKNSRGFLALTPLTSVAGWRIQYEQDPVKGLQLYLTPIQGAQLDPHVLPIGVAWNPSSKRYQSLDRTYEHFLSESPSLETAKSRLR